MILRAASLQLRSQLGDVAGNLDRMAEGVRQAMQEGCGLAVMPEAVVQGYQVQGANVELALSAQSAADELAQRVGAGSVSVVFGLYEKADGRPFNSSVYARLTDGQAEVRHVHRKVFLPTYGVFDEARYCQSGSSVRATDGLGMLICEDVWHAVMPALSALDGADFLAVPVASPGRGFSGEEPENVGRYRRMLQAAAEEHGMFVVSACLTGFESGKGLAGASMMFDPFGRLLAEAPLLQEAMIVADLDLALISAARSKSPLLADLRGKWRLLAAEAGRIAAEGGPDPGERPRGPVA